MKLNQTESDYVAGSSASPEQKARLIAQVRKLELGKAHCNCVHSTGTGECCNAYSEAGWLCSKLKGHDGEHVACTGISHGLHRWTNESDCRPFPHIEPLPHPACVLITISEDAMFEEPVEVRPA